MVVQFLFMSINYFSLINSPPLMLSIMEGTPTRITNKMLLWLIVVATAVGGGGDGYFGPLQSTD